MIPSTHPIEKMHPSAKLLWDIFVNQERESMDIKQGRRKSFDIEFIEVTSDNLDEVAAWCNGTANGTDEDRSTFIKLHDKNAINTRQTKAFVGDIVVHSKELGSFKSFGKKAFNKAFEEVVEVTPQREIPLPPDVKEARDALTAAEKLADEVAAWCNTEIPRDAGLGFDS